MINGRAHEDIICGDVWPDSMERSGPTGDSEWYIERYRDGRVLLKVDAIFTVKEWHTFLAALQQG